MKNLARGLKEEGLKVVEYRPKGKGEGIIQIKGLYKGEFYDIKATWEYGIDTDVRGIEQKDYTKELWRGHESNKTANHSESENTVNLEVYDVSEQDVSVHEVKKFDLRNIPGMVEWIKEIIS